MNVKDHQSLSLPPPPIQRPSIENSCSARMNGFVVRNIETEIE